ncbi:probable inactive receptor kinase At2g26730 [Cornus florida]|uniref:probable inactive receptor kinase At2g26730 n=1 Tax=Cornus florida TaxID=4283 RepID=UPI00289C68D0|nr:probable inactive receptor kinase At2g26730 [Cornus florida]
MLSRAFTKPRRSSGEAENSCRSIDEYGDCVIGFMEDMPLIFCGGSNNGGEYCVGPGGHGGGGAYLTLKGLLRASVGVLGESRLGMTEKVVLWVGKVCTVKRFTKVSVGRGEFGRRIQLLAQVSRRCEYLVPVNAFLYSKRIKFVVSDYHPMGSLADLLAGAREYGHTALEWNHRLIIVLHIARAIAFIHSHSPPKDRNLQLNVHGNIKASNVMINIDFSACLTDYGFTQLARRIEVSDTWPHKPPPPPPVGSYCDNLCQKSDVYNFGIVVLDILAGPEALGQMKCITQKKEEIKNGDIEFFEFSVEGKARKQAMQVLDIALACTNMSPDPRPSMEKVLLYLGDVLSGR